MNARKHLLQNCWFCLRLIFRHAPLVSGVYAAVAILSGLCTPISIYCLRALVENVTAYARQSVPLYAASTWGALYVLSLFGIEMFWFLQPTIGRYMNRKLRNTLMPAILRKFSDIDYSYYEQAHFHDMVARIGTRPQQTVVYSCYVLVVEIVKGLIRLLGTLGLFFAASLWVGVGAALIGIPIILLDAYAMDRRGRLLFTETRDQRQTEYIQNLFADKNAAYEFRVFGAKQHVLNLWHEFMGRVSKHYSAISKTNLRTSSVILLLKAAYMAFTISALAAGCINGLLGLGVFVSVASAIGQLFGSIEITSQNFAGLMREALGIEYFRELMSLPARERPEGLDIPRGADICFEHVRFAYPGTDRQVLLDVSFTIRAGEKVAIVGVNGAGKSTIVKLLCGLYAPDAGRVTIGGVDIARLSQQAIRKAVCVVFQEFGRYELSLRDNVAMGDLAKMNDDGALLDALRLAGADGLNVELDTRLGRMDGEGVDLSKGQWQRVAVSRAFLSDAQFVVLDEPTAALDPLAESRLYESFSQITQTRGSVIISHRLASAKIAHKIIVLNGGEVDAVGDHEALMAQGGLYATMFKEQSSWYKRGEEVETCEA